MTCKRDVVYYSRSHKITYNLFDRTLYVIVFVDGICLKIRRYFRSEKSPQTLWSSDALWFDIDEAQVLRCAGLFGQVAYNTLYNWYWLHFFWEAKLRLVLHAVIWRGASRSKLEQVPSENQPEIASSSPTQLPLVRAHLHARSLYAHFLISLLVLFQPNSFIPCWAAMAETTYRRRFLITIPSSPPRPRPQTPSPPSSPPTSPPPPYYPQEWRITSDQLQVHHPMSHPFHIIQTLLSLSKILWSSRKRNREPPKLDQMEYLWKENPEMAQQHIFGSSSWNFFRYFYFYKLLQLFSVWRIITVK